VTGIPGSELRQVLGIESQHHQIRIKRDPMEGIGVPVTDEPGMHFILAASGEALLQGPKRSRSARCNKNSYHSTHPYQLQVYVVVRVTPRASRGSVTGNPGTAMLGLISGIARLTE
jgi:hypothetical protein